jgi:integrase/recombinase XerD
MCLMLPIPKAVQNLETVDLDVLSQQTIGLWLHGKSAQTQRAYRRDLERLLTFTDKPLVETTLADLQAFADSLTDLAESSRTRTLAAVKSLFAFASKHLACVYPANIGAALKLPPVRDRLAGRILDEGSVQQLLASTRLAGHVAQTSQQARPEEARRLAQRDRVIILLLYAAAIRREELCGLRWRDCQARVIAGEATGQITVYGKGGKTRAIPLPSAVWQELEALRQGAPEDAPVFTSRQRNGQGEQALKCSQVYNIVRRAARRAELAKPVSPHWLRHAHASHALDAGAPLSLVQATLGHANGAMTLRYTHAQPNTSSAQFLKL